MTLLMHAFGCSFGEDWSNDLAALDIPPDALQWSEADRDAVLPVFAGATPVVRTGSTIASGLLWDQEFEYLPEYDSSLGGFRLPGAQICTAADGWRVSGTTSCYTHSGVRPDFLPMSPGEAEALVPELGEFRDRGLSLLDYRLARGWGDFGGDAQAGLPGKRSIRTYKVFRAPGGERLALIIATPAGRVLYAASAARP